MNFIGHATVASWSSTEPSFVLGSMLPDFAGMAGTRMSRDPPPRDTAEAASLAAGIALHHRTDDVFHAAPGFVGLMQDALDALTELGVSRATARAVGHVGVELLIDGELARTPEVERAYLAALGVNRPLDGVFVDADGDRRWQQLRERLLTYGVPYDYREPATVLRRLQVVLQHRPRLAIDPQAAPRILSYLPALQRKVGFALPALLEGVRAALS